MVIAVVCFLVYSKSCHNTHYSGDYLHTPHMHSVLKVYRRNTLSEWCPSAATEVTMARLKYAFVFAVYNLYIMPHSTFT